MYIELAQALNVGFPEIFGRRWSQTSQALQHHAMQGVLNMPSTAELTPKCTCSNTRTSSSTSHAWHSHAWPFLPTVDPGAMVYHMGLSIMGVPQFMDAS